MELVEKVDFLHGADVEQLPMARVPLASLATADSPRRSGESLEHVRRLAETEDGLPPILVHRPTMRIVDGMHRFRAARLRDQQEIEVRFFDGDQASAFVLAVQANIMHGLPLSLADRKAAAARVMTMYPQWSDRMVASATGLAAKTVAALRKRSDEDGQPLGVRVGRDGRARPVNGAQRRQIAARLMAETPGTSLREVARQAGISPETARDVRARQSHTRANGRRPGVRVSAVPATPASPVPAGNPRGTQALQALRGDPAFRSTESGRSLLRMLATFPIIEELGTKILDDAPVHCLSRVVESAQACARGWQAFAELAERRSLAP
jgi:hypothetical protein